MFTDKYIKAIKYTYPPCRIYEHGSDKGFGIQVSKNAKTFFIQYKSPISNKRRFMKMGSYPSTSLSSARKSCQIARELVDKGQDPQIERENEIRRQNATIKESKEQERIDRMTGSVDDLFDSYIRQLRKNGKRAAQDVELLYKKDIKPKLGKLKAKDVKPSEIREVIRNVYMRGAKIRASQVRTFLMAAYSHGIRSENDPTTNIESLFRLDFNPVRDIPVPAKPSVGERNLSNIEIYKLWHSLETTRMSLHMQVALKLLLATGGQRVEEVLGMRYSELDFDRQLWELAPIRTKNNKPHVVPLTDLSISIIKELSILQSDSDYVFPNRDNPNIPIPHRSLSKAVKRFSDKQIDSQSGIGRFTPRDLRRTVKSRMGELGISKEIRDILQNHARNDVSSKHYDRFDYLEPKRVAMNKWTEHLIHIIMDDVFQHNVIQIGR